MAGVLSLAHSEKQDTTAPRKKTFGHRPLVAFADHGQAGSGEPVAALLRPQRRLQHRRGPHRNRPTRPGTTLQTLRLGRQTLVRTDSGGSIHV
ncbi:hypothetical protein [Streptomyces huasconensis]|uniref:hypothetical protein n=1 Tax=Streptomyces TaxID=1883 RepID=UPI0038B56311